MGKAMNNLGVVIPAWNRGSVITEALDSVLNQTRPPLQVVVVDDGSTDGTGGIVDAWQKRNKLPFRFRYVIQENAGVSVARNRGAALLRNCSHVAFLDSDDLWPADFVEAALKDFELCGDELILWSRDFARYTAATGELSPQYREAFNDVYPAVKKAFYLNKLPVLSGTVALLADHYSVRGFLEGMLTGQDRLWMLQMARRGRWISTSGKFVRFRRDYVAIKQKKSDHLSRLQQTPEWQIARPATHEFYLMDNSQGSFLSRRKCADRLIELWKWAGREYLKEGHKPYCRWCYERAASIKGRRHVSLLEGFKLFGAAAACPDGWLSSRLLPQPVLPD
jgi:glycosyltransferase involved in cell wall biosynthesis